METIRKEAHLRARFVSDRVQKLPLLEQSKDLTDFIHDRPASILQCSRCSLLIRAEDPRATLQDYADDYYDPVAMEHLFPRYVAAFCRKEQPYRSLLPVGAEVLEIGCHLGAFLTVASDWGWKATGVDVGRDTTSFARSKGLITYQGTLEHGSFPSAHFDAAFVWNCFEQIADPHATLAEIKRVLKPGGLLILRTPNALFYRVCELFLASRPAGELATWVRRALGYNNLLAFPYLYGYESKTLISIAGAHGFRCEGKLNAQVITLTFPVPCDWICEEAEATRAALLEWNELSRFASAGYLTGPWMELFYRAS